MIEVILEVKTFHVKRSRTPAMRDVSRESFADTEFGEDNVQQILDVDPPGNATKRS